MAVLNKGQRNVEILKQKQYAPMSVEKQIAIIYLGTKGMLGRIPVDKIKAFEDAYLTFLETHHKSAFDGLKAGQLTDEITGTLERVAADMSKQYSA